MDVGLWLDLVQTLVVPALLWVGSILRGISQDLAQVRQEVAAVKARTDSHEAWLNRQHELLHAIREKP